MQAFNKTTLFKQCSRVNTQRLPSQVALLATEAKYEHCRFAICQSSDSRISYRAYHGNPRLLDTPDWRKASTKKPSAASLDNHRKHRAFIALGSNLGDRVAIIETACRRLEAHSHTRILSTSGLWETEPMYVEDQALFLNGACEVETSLPPLKLLDFLQSIENELGRIKIIDKGPRNIDLDILLYDNEVIESERLIVPHKLMLEREFVLRPLCQMIPNATQPRKSNGPNRSFLDHLQTLGSQSEKADVSTPPSKQDMPTPSPQIYTQVPISHNLPSLEPMKADRKTHVMAILNITPDSFSDGGLHTSQDLEGTIRQYLASGATILDIGGQSTRPGAKSVSAEQELERIMPAIKLSKTLIGSTGSEAAISVDTYRASVARAAVGAGANIINDVSAGTMDEAMFDVVAELGCTYAMMHMRGTPETMTSKLNTSYEGDLIETVAFELHERMLLAQRKGIRRWRLVLDPGIGFAKTAHQSLQILRRFEELKAKPIFEGIPWLIGASRKGFIGNITNVSEPRERVWGTAAAVSAAVMGGADIVRVHDVEEMAKVAQMGDAIWRW